jgi:hypothetical protein
MHTKTVAAVLVVAALVGAAACDDRHSFASPSPPTTPSTSTPTPTPVPAPLPSEIPTTLVVTGATSSSGTTAGASWLGMIPGETADFTAIATFADGSTRDVTGSATWTRSSLGAVSVHANVVRAEVSGWGEVEVAYRSGQSTVSTGLRMRVAPEGAFLLDFSVNDGHWELPDVPVRVVSDAGTFGATTIAVMPITLPAVGATVVEVGFPFLPLVEWSQTVRSDGLIDCRYQAGGTCRFEAYAK